jgi:hypothetical protein
VAGVLRYRDVHHTGVTFGELERRELPLEDARRAGAKRGERTLDVRAP